jgi:nucleotide-binding universal stress UspA family protein
MFDRILLAVDASEHSRGAVDIAADVARRFGSAVLVLHVREPRMAETGDHLETEAEAQELAEWAAGEIRKSGATATVEVRTAGIRGAAGAILAAAQAYQPGLIVIGTRGLSDLPGLLVGSVSHKIFHLAPCPVLVAR